jgi:hypothetical protein
MAGAVLGAATLRGGPDQARSGAVDYRIREGMFLPRSITLGDRRFDGVRALLP